MTSFHLSVLKLLTVMADLKPALGLELPTSGSYTLAISDGFELEFSGSSEPELKIFRAESSRAGAF